MADSSMASASAGLANAGAGTGTLAGVGAVLTWLLTSSGKAQGWRKPRGSGEDGPGGSTTDRSEERDLDLFFVLEYRWSLTFLSNATPKVRVNLDPGQAVRV
jgi:hypothetical protein